MRRLLFLALLIAPATANAQEGKDVVSSDGTSRVTNEERPFVHLYDPSTPSVGHVGAGYSFGLGSGVAASRPLPANITTAGASHAIGAAYGVTDRFAPFAGVTTDVAAGATVSAGARVQLTDPLSAFRFGLAGAAFREGKGGTFGLWARAIGSYDLGRVRLAGNVHVERAFATGRDTIDVLAMGGVSVRVAGGVRLGAEYVGQDLEDAIEQEEAEGGAKHFAGPTAALDISGGRLQIVMGPAFGLNANSPRFLGRIGVLASF